MVEYKNAHTKIKILCPTHGVFEQTPTNHLKGKGCPICQESKGEIKITNILNNKNIKHIKQYKFDECKYKRKLPFDFYLPELNMCIEFEVIAHSIGAKAEVDITSPPIL